MPIGAGIQTYRKTKETNIFKDDKSIDKIIKRLQKMGDEAKEDVRKVMRKGGEMVKDTARSLAPVAKKPVKRWRSGKVVATYYPGNLQRSIRILNLRRTEDIFVGPKVAKTKAGQTGEFRTAQRVDAYYAHMVEKGSINHDPVRYMQTAADRNRPVIINMAKNEIKALAKKYNSKA